MNRIDSDFLGRLKPPAPMAGERLYIDAGVGHLRLRVCADDGRELENAVLPSNRDLRALFAERGVAQRFGVDEASRIFITGKLASTVQQALGGGHTFLQSGALWLAARDRVTAKGADSLAMIEVTASGYTLVGVDGEGKLKDDLLVVNPRCGAGTGVNIDRVLQKLGLGREEVDAILADYLGEAGRDARDKITVRATRRCRASSTRVLSAS